jgi:hypothetical protein
MEGSENSLTFRRWNARSIIVNDDFDGSACLPH